MQVFIIAIQLHFCINMNITIVSDFDINISTMVINKTTNDSLINYKFCIKLINGIMLILYFKKTMHEDCILHPNVKLNSSYLYIFV